MLATERLKRTEASSTLRSNSVIFPFIVREQQLDRASVRVLE
jgi:hypothetical protein